MSGKARWLACVVGAILILAPVLAGTAIAGDEVAARKKGLQSRRVSITLEQALSEDGKVAYVRLVESGEWHQKADLLAPQLDWLPEQRLTFTVFPESHGYCNVGWKPAPYAIGSEWIAVIWEMSPDWRAMGQGFPELITSQGFFMPVVDGVVTLPYGESPGQMPVADFLRKYGRAVVEYEHF
jgi:hypothetical protein